LLPPESVDSFFISLWTTASINCLEWVKGCVRKKKKRVSRQDLRNEEDVVFFLKNHVHPVNPVDILPLKL